MKYLIVNADDFGIHTDVNKGIIKAYNEGCLTSTSLISVGKAAEEAAELAIENPGLGVGLHFTLVAEKPALPVDKVSTLVDDNGYFFPDHVAFIKRFLLGKIDLSQLQNECEAQITKAEKLGVSITHIDSHQHLHVLPHLSNICFDIAKRHNINKMRFPGENVFFKGNYPVSIGRMLARDGLTVCAKLARFHGKKEHFTMPDYFFGMVAGGNLLEKYFMSILSSLPENKVSEIMIHPGINNQTVDNIYHWHYHWEEELQSLLSCKAKKFIGDNNIKLISYKELSNE